MKPDRLADRLTYRVDMVLEGFERTHPRGEVRQLAFAPRSAKEWYRAFRDRVLSAKGYLPIYRMSDGEFIFVCGRLPQRIQDITRRPVAVAKSWLKHAIGWKTKDFLSGTPENSFESYTREEWARARRDYGTRVASISRKGVLAINLIEQGGFAREYWRPFMDWLDAEGVVLTDENFTSFYFIYAMFLGPDAGAVVSGKRILVVTCPKDGTKAPAIDGTLRRLGARSTVFAPISENKSMTDRIAIPPRGTIDLVLIGAGVGALNILEQVEELEVPSIDVGFVLDCYWDAATFRGKRAFTLPDSYTPAGERSHP